MIAKKSDFRQVFLAMFIAVWILPPGAALAEKCRLVEGQPPWIRRNESKGLHLHFGQIPLEVKERMDTEFHWWYSLKYCHSGCKFSPQKRHCRLVRMGKELRKDAQKLLVEDSSLDGLYGYGLSDEGERLLRVAAEEEIGSGLLADAEKRQRAGHIFEVAKLIAYGLRLKESSRRGNNFPATVAPPDSSANAGSFGFHDLKSKYDPYRIQLDVEFGRLAACFHPSDELVMFLHPYETDRARVKIDKTDVNVAVRSLKRAAQLRGKEEYSEYWKLDLGPSLPPMLIRFDREVKSEESRPEMKFLGTWTRIGEKEFSSLKAMQEKWMERHPEERNYGHKQRGLQEKFTKLAALDANE